MKIQNTQNDLLSLNDHLYDDYFVDELEARLETDPLIMGGLVDLLQSNSNSMETTNEIIKLETCSEITCHECQIYLCSCVLDLCGCFTHIA